MAQIEANVNAKIARHDIRTGQKRLDQRHNPTWRACRNAH